MPRPVDNGPPGRDEFLVHLAIAIKDNEELESVKLKRNANRKRAKAAGIELGDMDFTIKVLDWSPSDVAQFFSRKFAYLAHAAVNIGSQFDLFQGPTPTPKADIDVRALGLSAGLKGKNGVPPPHLKGPEAQLWMEGWHESQRAMAEAMGRRAAAAAPTKPEEPAAAKELVLKASDFTGDANWDQCELLNYSGNDDLAEYERIVVTDDDETEEVVLKDVAAGIGISDAEFEAKPEELDSQSTRKALKAKAEGATS